jgi:GxxExxY protein
MSDVSNYQHADLTSLIIKEAYHVYNKLGYGFVESVYENSLAIRLRKAGLKVECQHPIKVYFEEEVVGDFKADILANNVAIVELKAVESLHVRHEVQLVNYLKATDIEVGLLINFGEELKIKRKVFENARK